MNACQCHQLMNAILESACKMLFNPDKIISDKETLLTRVINLEFVIIIFEKIRLVI